jgi:hypothetical protein
VAPFCDRGNEHYENFSTCVPGQLPAFKGGLFMINVPRIEIPVHMHEILQLHSIIHTQIR